MRTAAMALLLLFPPAQVLVGQSKPIAPVLDTFIEGGMKDWQIPGLSVVIVKEGAVLYEKGFGARELGKPGKVDADTLFGMMSTTKAMTALAVGLLVDEKKLAWDDPVIKHLPKLRLPNAYLTEHVTLRDLLRHTSGLQNADLLTAREDLDTQDILARLDRVPTTAALRSDFVYHNVLYQVAGEVVAAASGMSWDRFVTLRILKPLGMSRSRATLREVLDLKDGNVSRAHMEIDGRMRAIEETRLDHVPAAGAVWTTAHDAGKWLSFLLAGGVVDGRRLVSEASFRELFLPQVAVPPGQWPYPTLSLTASHWTTYGLGWFQQDYRGQFVATHSGSVEGRTAMVGLIPEAKVGVFVFGNLDHAEFRHALLWKVLDLCTGAPDRDWNRACLELYRGLKAKAALAEREAEQARVPGTRPSHPLAAYVGTYSHPAWGEVVVAQEGDRLVFHLGASPSNAGPLEHWHFDTFRTRLGDGRSGWSLVGFTLALDGSVGAVVLDDPTLTFTRVVEAPSAKP